jgi:predicted MFS family arabinose efflux permease
MAESVNGRPIQRLPLYGLYAANVISTSGNVMAFIAIPWFVLQTTGSASQTGLTAAVTALPAVIAAFFGGVLVDRIGYKRTSVLADLASGIAMALVPLRFFIPRRAWRSGSYWLWYLSATCSTRPAQLRVWPCPRNWPNWPECPWSELRHLTMRCHVARGSLVRRWVEC